MSEQQFAIVFRGRLVAGADPVQVRANFAKLFNIEAARVEQMFGGQPVIIKKGLDLLSADKYKAALAKAGALVDAIDMPLDAAPSASRTAAACASWITRRTSGSACDQSADTDLGELNVRSQPGWCLGLPAPWISGRVPSEENPRRSCLSSGPPI